MKKRKILFLGESYRADAITWMNGLKEFGNFDIISWELKTPNTGIKNRIKRILEFKLSFFQIKKIIKQQQPDMVIAERTTSYGFLAALSGVKPIAIAQQGRTDLWPEHSVSLPLKRLLQHYAFQKADLIHAWGPVMTCSMKEANVDMNKVMVLSKGINLELFKKNTIANTTKIKAIVTRSLLPEYRHDIILKAFSILNQKGIDFVLTIVGNGNGSRIFACNACIKEDPCHHTNKKMSDDEPTDCLFPDIRKLALEEENKFDNQSKKFRKKEKNQEERISGELALE